MITLEPYKSKSSRFECPACGRKNVFSRYVDGNGEHIAPEVGRCNREVKCGYHLTPKEYFAARGTAWTPPVRRPKPKPAPMPLVEIPAVYFEKSQAGRERNAFVQFLMGRYDHADVLRVCEAYGVGSFEDFTTFWRVDGQGRIWTAKLIRYDAATGKRRKDLEYSFDWMHALLKRREVLPELSDYRRVLFGAHLLSDSGAPVAIVESEKTAVIARLELPEYLWLACGGRTQISTERLCAFGNRRVLLFPDSDSFDYWSKLASEARSRGANVVVSDLLETELTPEQKADGYDLADYFLMPELEAIPPVVEVVTAEPEQPATVAFTPPRIHDHAALFVGNCKRCGDYLQPDGGCNLCKRPLPF